MLNKLTATNKNDRVATLLRFTLGIVMFPHGAQKVLGWFGGYGFSATMDAFTGKMGIPWVFAFLALMAEFLGALCLLFGFMTRIAAFSIAVVMAVAVLMIHHTNGFFMNWNGSQSGEGFEYHLLAIGIAIALIVRGGGTASIDACVCDKKKSKH